VTDHGLFADGVEAVDVDAKLHLGRSVYRHKHMHYKSSSP